MVVLAIVVILTSMLMPGLRSVREAANRLACANNMRQIGYAITSYANDNGDFLPASVFSIPDNPMPQELMALTSGGTDSHFDGIGRLLPHAGCYLDSPGCMYCPSHHGEHSLERYESTLEAPFLTPDRAYANYHYRGDTDTETSLRYRLDNSHNFVMLSDGLRTRSDFNHGDGLNLLYGDLAVSFYFDSDKSIYETLPEDPLTVPQTAFFNLLWKTLVTPND